MNKHHPDEPKPESINPVVFKEPETAPREATTPQVEKKKYLYLCPIEGCEFAKMHKAIVSRHMNQEHPDQFRTNIPWTEIKEEEDISITTGKIICNKKNCFQKKIFR